MNNGQYFMPLPKVSVGIRLEADHVQKLDELAEKFGKTRTDLIVEAVLDYWKLDEKKKSTLTEFEELKNRVETIETTITKLK